MEERIRSTHSSLAVFVGCCAMSFIGFALITKTLQGCISTPSAVIYMWVEPRSA